MGALKPAGLPARYVIVGAASALAAAVFWLVYTWPVAVQYLPHFSVEYSNGVGRALQLEVVNETGRPVVFCATLYGWLPNGSFAQIGWRCGEGAVSMDKSSLDEYLRHFAGVPGEVGVIAFITYVSGTDRSGRPALARSAAGFTVDPREALRRDAVRVTMRVKSRGAPRRQVAAAKYSLQWPPQQIDEGCYAADNWYVCYYWQYDYSYETAYHTRIPLAAVRVFYDYYKYYGLRVKAYLQVQGSNYVYFRGSAAIKYKGVSSGYSADIFTITLKNETVYLDTEKSWLYPSRPIMAAVGFYGDYAVARYKEMKIDPLCPSGCETGYTADVYLARPTFLHNGTIEKF
ncbi:MAG: hypothetical protein LM577_03980 [Thermoproteaceae archaeon]|nr:hypothetical protein [Thermoproteaceae archaeon]